MAFYDSKTNTIVYFSPVLHADYPGWQEIDCGCSSGLIWGGECPTDCERCEGSGYLFHHIKTGVLAQWPGGPFAGSLEKEMSKKSKHRR